MTEPDGPVTARLIVEADGGSRGNPGPAGYGSVVRDARSGKVLEEVSASLGVATNNVAEYSGLIAGLRAAAKLAPGADTEVRMDSKLVVEQMSGRWQLKHPALVPLAAQARQAARALGRVTYTWVPRARNTHADRLANQAMDEAAAARASGAPQPGGPTGSDGATGTGDTSEASDADSAGLRFPSLSQRGESIAPAVTTRGNDGAPAGPGGAGGQDLLSVPGREVAWRPGAPTTVVLLRHGETPWSPERRYAGRSDIPLTAHGLRQAGAVAARLAARPAGDPPVTAIVASPLRRARQTAAAVGAATGLPVMTDPAWAEVDFGDWEGLTHAEARQRWPAELAAWQVDTAAAPPGGESLATATRRVLGGLDALLRGHRGGCVLVVSHVTPIKIVLLHALEAPVAAVQRVYLDVASLCETDWYPDGTGLVRSVNDTAHLLPHHTEQQSTYAG